jgi:intein/homing endonuclease
MFQKRDPSIPLVKKKYIYNVDVLLKEDDISYYLLGLFIADGNVIGSKNCFPSTCRISLIDYELLEKIRDLICPNKAITKCKDIFNPETKEIIKNKSYSFCFHSKIMCEWLIKNECVPNKTKIAKFPNIPEKYIPDFIRGLLDGDGSTSIHNNHLHQKAKKTSVRFDSASYELIAGFQQALSKYGIDTRIEKTKWITTTINGRQTQTTTQMYRLALTGLKAYKLLKIVYRHDRLSLARKKDIAQEIYQYVERNGFTEEELLKMDKLPVKKWQPDDVLFDLMMKHKGSLVEAAKEINTAGWTLSSRLRKIGLYDKIRAIYPFDNIQNIKKMRRKI